MITGLQKLQKMENQIPCRVTWTASKTVRELDINITGKLKAYWLK